jgi:hypothetical protein
MPTNSTDGITRRNRLRIASTQRELDQSSHELLKGAVQKDLQQGFRYLLRVRGLDVAYITSVKRPTYNIETEEHNLLNWTFNYPSGRVKWEPIQFTVVELFSRDISTSIGAILMKKVRDLGIDNPAEITPGFFKDMSKSSLIESMGNISIEMLDPDGDVYEEWKLTNAFITGVDFSDLKYNQDGLTNIAVSVSYDWAELIYHG